MQSQTSPVVEDWLDDEIASLENSVTRPAQAAAAAPSGKRSRGRRSLYRPRRPVLDTGRYLVYALGVMVGAATGWLIAVFLSRA